MTEHSSILDATLFPLLPFPSDTRVASVSLILRLLDSNGKFVQSGLHTENAAREANWDFPGRRGGRGKSPLSPPPLNVPLAVSLIFLDVTMFNSSSDIFVPELNLKSLLLLISIPHHYIQATEFISYIALGVKVLVAAFWEQCNYEFFRSADTSFSLVRHGNQCWTTLVEYCASRILGFALFLSQSA